MAWAEVADGRPFVLHRLAPTPDTFVLGVNLHGEALAIDGQRWWSQREAVEKGLVLPADVLVTTTSVTPVPAVDPAVAAMLNTAVHRPDRELPLSLPLGDGAYTVELWLMENFEPGHRSLTITIEGGVVAQRVQAGDAVGTWHRLSFPVDIHDGRLDLVIGAPGEQSHLMGFSVRRR
jgi:hypothetical protein